MAKIVTNEKIFKMYWYIRFLACRILLSPLFICTKKNRYIYIINKNDIIVQAKGD